MALRSRADAIAFPVPEKALATSILGEAKVASADATQNQEGKATP